MAGTGPTSRSEDLTHIEQVLTHFEQLEAQFQQVRQGLTHSHRLTTLGTLASIIAHEYNNILTPIISYAQLALASPDDRELLIKAVEKALSGAERAAAISGSLLGFSRDGDEPPVANLPRTVRDTLLCLARDPQKDGIELDLDLPDLELAISPLNLQQVLLNLILNAKKAMRRTGGRLTLRATVQDQQAMIEISDTGPGIPPQIMDRLFEPFVTHVIDRPAARRRPGRNGKDHSNDVGGGSRRGNGKSNGNGHCSAADRGRGGGGDADTEPVGGAAFIDETDQRGTGLGLCICRDLIRHAGGDITAHNRPDGGACFHIRLPLTS